MRECPACHTTYTDETLRYCLTDGTPLVDTAETATVFSGPNDRMRVDIPQLSDPQLNMPPPIHQKKAGSGKKILAVLAILAVLGLIVVAAGGALIYFNLDKLSGLGVGEQNKNTSPTPTNTATPNPSPSTTPDKASELEKQIANLQKQIEEQSKNGSPANSTTAGPGGLPMDRTARVNSPGDGFLALRTLPSSQIGDRIAKIPHGATIRVGVCGPVMEGSKRPGRWCQASYSGMTGWVYDAYLIY
ncbi:MAG: hypothetical protein IT172_05590 [Acidobacteria bacterium]|nr:hypothetical protein [Acidobacteriota bacterium]